jgi:hypothetical protein
LSIQRLWEAFVTSIRYDPPLPEPVGGSVV